MENDKLQYSIALKGDEHTSIVPGNGADIEQRKTTYRDACVQQPAQLYFKYADGQLRPYAPADDENINSYDNPEYSKKFKDFLEENGFKKDLIESSYNQQLATRTLALIEKSTAIQRELQNLPGSKLIPTDAMRCCIFNQDGKTYVRAQTSNYAIEAYNAKTNQFEYALTLPGTVQVLFELTNDGAKPVEASTDNFLLYSFAENQIENLGDASDFLTLGRNKELNDQATKLTKTLEDKEGVKFINVEQQEASQALQTVISKVAESIRNEKISYIKKGEELTQEQYESLRQVYVATHELLLYPDNLQKRQEFDVLLRHRHARADYSYKFEDAEWDELQLQIRLSRLDTPESMYQINLEDVPNKNGGLGKLKLNNWIHPSPQNIVKKIQNVDDLKQSLLYRDLVRSGGPSFSGIIYQPDANKREALGNPSYGNFKRFIEETGFTDDDISLLEQDLDYQTLIAKAVATMSTAAMINKTNFIAAQYKANIYKKNGKIFVGIEAWGFELKNQDLKVIEKIPGKAHFDFELIKGKGSKLINASASDELIANFMLNDSHAVEKLKNGLLQENRKLNESVTKLLTLNRGGNKNAAIEKLLEIISDMPDGNLTLNQVHYLRDLVSAANNFITSPSHVTSWPNFRNVLNQWETLLGVDTRIDDIKENMHLFSLLKNLPNDFQEALSPIFNQLQNTMEKSDTLEPVIKIIAEKNPKGLSQLIALTKAVIKYENEQLQQDCVKNLVSLWDIKSLMANEKLPERLKDHINGFYNILKESININITPQKFLAYLQAVEAIEDIQWSMENGAKRISAINKLSSIAPNALPENAQRELNVIKANIQLVKLRDMNAKGTLVDLKSKGTKKDVENVLSKLQQSFDPEMVKLIDALEFFLTHPVVIDPKGDYVQSVTLAYLNNLAQLAGENKEIIDLVKNAFFAKEKSLSKNVPLVSHIYSILQKNKNAGNSLVAQCVAVAHQLNIIQTLGAFSNEKIEAIRNINEIFGKRFPENNDLKISILNLLKDAIIAELKERKIEVDDAFLSLLDLTETIEDRLNAYDNYKNNYEAKNIVVEESNIIEIDVPEDNEKEKIVKNISALVDALEDNENNKIVRNILSQIKTASAENSVSIEQATAFQLAAKKVHDYQVNFPEGQSITEKLTSIKTVHDEINDIANLPDNSKTIIQNDIVTLMKEEAIARIHDVASQGNPSDLDLKVASKITDCLLAIIGAINNSESYEKIKNKTVFAINEINLLKISLRENENIEDKIIALQHVYASPEATDAVKLALVNALKEIIRDELENFDGALDNGKPEQAAIKRALEFIKLQLAPEKSAAIEQVVALHKAVVALNNLKDLIINQNNSHEKIQAIQNLVFPDTMPVRVKITLQKNIGKALIANLGRQHEPYILEALNSIIEKLELANSEQLSNYINAAGALGLLSVPNKSAQQAGITTLVNFVKEKTFEQNPGFTAKLQRAVLEGELIKLNREIKGLGNNPNYLNVQPHVKNAQEKTLNIANEVEKLLKNEPQKINDNYVCCQKALSATAALLQEPSDANFKKYSAMAEKDKMGDRSWKRKLGGLMLIGLGAVLGLTAAAIAVGVIITTGVISVPAITALAAVTVSKMTIAAAAITAAVSLTGAAVSTYAGVTQVRKTGLAKAVAVVGTVYQKFINKIKSPVPANVVGNNNPNPPNNGNGSAPNPNPPPSPPRV